MAPESRDASGDSRPREHYGPRGVPKRGYSKHGAKVVARRTKGHRPEVYRCSICDRWHVGHGRAA